MLNNVVGYWAYIRGAYIRGGGALIFGWLIFGMRLAHWLALVFVVCLYSGGGGGLIVGGLRYSGTFSRLAAQAGCAIPVLRRHVAFRNREFSGTILPVRQTTQRNAVQEEYIEINQTFAGSLFTSFSSQERFLHIHRLRFSSGTQ